MNSHKVQRLINSNEFSLIMMPTEQCNFKCQYCYEEHRNIAYSDRTIQAIKELLYRRGQRYQVLNIEWFGGEPLLKLRSILDIMKTAQSAFQVVRGGITSNGYLLNSNTIDELYAVGVKHYQITLDGDKEHHDKTRLTKSKRATFDKIWGNLLLLKESEHLDLDVTIRIHLTTDNLDSVTRLLREISAKFETDKRFHLLFKPIVQLGGENDSQLNVIPTHLEEPIVNALEQIAGKINKNFATHQKLLDTNSYCYASNPHHLVIRANGDINKCTVALDKPENTVGKLNSDGSISINEQRFKYWLRGLENLEPDVLLCPNYQPQTKL
ncbi:Radical SAM core domain-containing protein [Vibrio crassostreae]|uniref:radical SAM protein n=1 Tax=Vibrio crassostreae TaxID=246167 RepID=UPI000F477D94|nr:radical SAM protein [Vibrio crassostreae]ROR19786.1 uncharacterized protein EDB36_101935 [Vibrio crassostreae]CAK1718470.1 Radical SAM core domain-containing protein [Vibrio crassostreae]CAK2223647.1 Radical SAM core domain-containing protein [Vibrio crassostreae]CAK2320666.1 Radical SAM core domain-containing protein [Vibrio crassostreae]CAK3428253.1 Radical SAM core domain-containing protein [Vibrio crassostreae]